ncbi:rDNA-binding RNA polymerase I transcriptional factor [Sporobolomyces salmoneus]|uniref:rDNA-binding RNA polymerase I transcriptional factor n=1 Tax=Sporobolomyces salmoneus TaxID=183962 RepID=UPI003171041F
MAPPPAPTVSKRSRSSENGVEEEKPKARRSKSQKPDKQRDTKEKEKGKDKSSKRGNKGKGKESTSNEPNGPYRRAMYSAFLNDAFEKRYRGDNSSYNEIISQFRALLPSSASLPVSQDPSTSTQPPSTTPLVQLRTWLDALTSVVSKLDQSHEPLVETILAVPWATTEEAFVSAYMRFIGALVSARTEWLKGVLDKCVKGFKYRSPYTLASPAALPHLTRRLIYTRLHSLLRLLLSLVPTLSPSLSPLLALHFPSKREPRAAQICYIDNLLSLTEYCTALAEDVLTLVVERALNIDVEIQGDPEDWEEVEEEMEARQEAELAQKERQNKIDDLKAAVGDLVDRPMTEDPTDSDDSDQDDDDDDDDSDGGLDLENLSSDDDEPEPINDEDAVKLARKGNAKMSEAAIRKVLDNRSKLDGILRVVLDHLAAAHDDNRSTTVPPTPASVATPTVKFGELSTATEFPFDFRDPQSSAQSTPCGSKEPTPTPLDLPPSAEQLERRTTLFRTLLDIFDRTLLRTFKTRNVQFVLFYLCSRDTTASDHFVGVLLGRALFDVDAPSVTRVAAAGYVASFVARAKFVDSGMTRKVVRHLCQYLEGQMDDFARFGGNGTGRGGIGGQELPVFYAVSQAVFYIFCFRWKDLLEEEEDIDDEVGLLGLDAGRKWMMGLETLKKAVSSSFNPLKVCAQPVVAQFASIAHKTGFMYCYSIIEGNRRSASYRDPTQTTPSSVPPTPGVGVPMPPLRSVSTSSLLTTLTANSLSLGSSSSSNMTPSATTTPLTTPSIAPRQLLVAEEMDSFFPFDPFKLPLSSVYIDEIYREWEGADEDDDDDDDESDTATDDDSSTDASTSQASEDEKSWTASGGLAVPGMHKRGGANSPMHEDEEDEVARSFEAMSISFSPDHASFGGRRAFEQAQNARRGKVIG